MTKPTPDSLSPIHHPCMIVLQGKVHFALPNLWEVLEPGRLVSLTRHGSFEVEHTGDSYGIIRHTTTNGRLIRLFIPERDWLIVSDGIFRSYECNYDSFVKTCRISYLAVRFLGSRQINPLLVGPFYIDTEREFWANRFKGESKVILGKATRLVFEVRDSAEAAFKPDPRELAFLLLGKSRLDHA